MYFLKEKIIKFDFNSHYKQKDYMKLEALWPAKDYY